jgi:protein gp37
MNRTKIEWVKNPDGTQGYTWNPITGCLNHVNGLCKGGGFPCYAYKLANGRLSQRYLANHNVANWQTDSDIEKVKAYNDPFYPRFWEERLYDFRLIPHRDMEPKCRGIFVCDMGDLFGIGIPEEWTRLVLSECQQSPHNRFYLLTKQSQNLIKFSPFPENCWVGVTATGYGAFNAALDKLKCIGAKVKYISIEPLLEAIPFSEGRLAYCGINWLIIGVQTNPYKPPVIKWVREIVNAADKAGIKVFLKDNLRPLLNANSWEYETLWQHIDSKTLVFPLKPRQELP